jgi:hypothetical protein
MNLAEIEDAVEQDLRVSPSRKVIYLEGKTDPVMLFALLGLPNPDDGLHQGVLVKGLKDEGSRSGSGAKAVMARVDLAPRFQPSKIFGIIDGDGRTLDDLRPSFDPDHTGPLFSWKAYSIENLVAKTGWPTAWGDEPDWPAELMKYGPYVALNRIGLEVRAILHELGLDKYRDPIQGAPLRPREEIAAALAVGKARLLSFDVEMKYLAELVSFDAIVQNSLDEAHALINGKWLFRLMAPTLTGRDTSRCEYEWLAHARSAGGLPEVREWWERVTGNPP